MSGEVPGANPPRQARVIRGDGRDLEGVEGVHAACTPTQVSSPPLAGTAAWGERQTREVAPARHALPRSMAITNQNKQTNHSKIILAQGVQHVGVPASGQYGYGIRRAPCFHNA